MDTRVLSNKRNQCLLKVICVCLVVRFEDAC